MHCRLHHLNRSVIPNLHRCIRRQRHLRKTECPWVWVLARANDLENRNHGERHVGWTASGSICAEAQVHVEECSSMALEPSGLKSDCSACCGPQSTVCGCWHAATRIHPLHPIRKGIIRNQVVSSPSRVRDDSMSQNLHAQDCCCDKSC